MKLRNVLSSCTDNFAYRLCSKELIDFLVVVKKASKKDHRGNNTAVRGILLDPEMFRLVLEERARMRPEASEDKPEQFFDGSWVRKVDKEVFFKKSTRADATVARDDLNPRPI
jgi:hypothetical protein